MTQDVETVAEEEYFRVPLDMLRAGSRPPGDVYVRTLTAPYRALVHPAGQELDDEFQARLRERHVRDVLLRKEDEESYYEYLEEHIPDIVESEGVARRRVAEVLYDSAARVMNNVFTNPRSGHSLRRAGNMVKATVSAVMHDREAVWHMTSLASHDYYTHTHCVNVCVFLVAAARELLGIGDRQRLEVIGLGGLLHDVGKTTVPQQILKKPGKLTPEEFDVVKQHPMAGVEIVQRHVTQAAALAIVRSHHERFDGSGYPHGLAGERIPVYARLSTVIDVYDALTTNRPYARARTPFDALDLMMHQMSDHFEPRLLRAFVRFLGPQGASGGERPDVRRRPPAGVMRAR